MEIIKKHIGKNWRNVFRKLDYSNGEIEQLYIDYINEGISEVIAWNCITFCTFLYNNKCVFSCELS